MSTARLAEPDLQDAALRMQRGLPVPEDVIPFALEVLADIVEAVGESEGGNVSAEEVPGMIREMRERQEEAARDHAGQLEEAHAEERKLQERIEELEGQVRDLESTVEHLRATRTIKMRRARIKE